MVQLFVSSRTQCEWTRNLFWWLANKMVQDDKDVVLMACAESYIALRFASDRLKDDKEFVIGVRKI
jgi:uncharacterized protein YdeI (YjbR/CyaY-like superfamily)